MSGIAGLYFLDGRVLHQSDLSRVMTPVMDAIKHRGPDGSRVWSGEAVVLGHQMLRTTLESLDERLPLESEIRDGSRNVRGPVVTSDARIDNRQELIAAFGIHGRATSAIPDSELILRAYERWGERCTDYLLGDFAFAVWDPSTRTIFCARDHMGVKPLYYHRSGRFFAFASEIKALLAVPDVPQRLNEDVVARYIELRFDDPAATFYQDIRRLPPAHSMTVSPSGIRIRCYWSLEPAREISLGSDREYADALREIFITAVDCRLRSSFPVGSELSGGLDSSSVVCVARNLLARRANARLHTFSATFADVPEADERQYIDAVLAHPVGPSAVEGHFVPCDRMNPLAEIDELVAELDEPFWAPSMYMYSALYGTAHGCGVRVLLSGDDGDNAIGHGVGRIALLLRTGQWLRAKTEISSLAERFEMSPQRIFRAYGLRPLSPKPLLRLWEFVKETSLAERWGFQEQGAKLAKDVIERTFARRRGAHRLEARRLWRPQGPREPWEQRRQRDNRVAERRGILEEWRNLTDGLIPTGCETFGTVASHQSLEIRYPFLDRRLVEFCLAVPVSQKLQDGWTRAIMRRAMDGILPDSVRWRGGKARLGPNFDRTLLMFGKERAERSLLKEPGILGTYMNLPKVQAIYRHYTADGGRTPYESIWTAITLGTWLAGFGGTNVRRT